MASSIPSKKDYSKEYKKLFEEMFNSNLSKTEWNSKGDGFKKFSLFTDQTSVKLSGNTVLKSKAL